MRNWGNIWGEPNMSGGVKETRRIIEMDLIFVTY
jgi:hypothetical protein